MQAFDNIKNDALLRPFFVNLCLYQLASDPWALFKKFKKEFCAGEMHKAQVDEPTEAMINHVLMDLKQLFDEQSKDMADFIGIDNMPKNEKKEKTIPREILDETNFDIGVQEIFFEQQYASLNAEQILFVDCIIDAVENNKGGLFAVEANGGCGKTFCINTLLAHFRAKGMIALAMATTGQAATLFDRGIIMYIIVKYIFHLVHDIAKKND